MFNMVMREVVGPLSRRAGTALAGWLLALGVASDTTTTIVAGAAAGIGVGMDLILSHIGRKMR